MALFPNTLQWLSSLLVLLLEFPFAQWTTLKPIDGLWRKAAVIYHLDLDCIVFLKPSLLTSLPILLSPCYISAMSLHFSDLQFPSTAVAMRLCNVWLRSDHNSFVNRTAGG